MDSPQNEVPSSPKTEANAPPPKKKKDKENRILLIILIILALLLFFLGWQYWNQRQTIVKEVKIVEVETTKSDSVTNDLIALQGQYSMLKTNNKDIEAQLEQKKDTINFLMQQAEKYKNDPYIIAQLKKETKTLRVIMQSFVHTIDSLNTLNIQLKKEKNVAVESLKVEKNTTAVLKKEKGELQSKIVSGSLLDATSISAEGVFFRFGKKEVETGKARKAEKLKVQFTLTANRIAKTGSKTIYVRVISPDAKELSRTEDESSLFNFEGTKGFYSGMQTIDYANQEMSISMYCESSKGFVPGKYIIKLYSDGAEIGETSITLK